jgi:hypothetical protein
MIPWYAPTDMRIWCSRLLAPRSVVLVCVLAVVGITEFRFDWIEKAVGAYLVSTNAYRPRSGAIWDKGREADSARQALAQYTDQRQDLQREVRQAVSLGQIVSNLAEGKGAMISAEHFVELYLKLPPVLSHEIASPYTLLTYLSSGRWQRTFLERQDQQLLVYMLDANNQVIHHLGIGQILLSHIERGEVAIRTGLDQLSDFNAHIYPAERFFAELAGMPEEARKRVVSHPEDLLRVDGRIERVGISDQIIGDAVDLGFEVNGLDGPRVILMQGVKQDVLWIQSILEEGASPRWPWAKEKQP